MLDTKPTGVHFPTKPLSDILKAAEDAQLPPLTQPRLPLLEARQTTHGDFADNARISQTLKDAYRAAPGWANLSDIEREAMDMIALKFSRILSGRSMERQHWEDVVGYAKLIEERCS